MRPLTTLYALCAALITTIAAAQSDWDADPTFPSARPSAPASVPLVIRQPVPPMAVRPEPARPATRESLYVERDFQALTSDRRVHRVGDLLTVLIFENASATSSADTGSSRDASVGVGLARTTYSLGASVSANNDFTGVGRTQRAGRVLAQLTVTVRDIAPNQDLILGGEQQLEINGEKQVIRIEGRARPRDISELNTVVSTRIADARISFIGDGVLADRQRPGWWHQLLSLFGL